MLDEQLRTLQWHFLWNNLFSWNLLFPENKSRRLLQLMEISTCGWTVYIGFYGAFIALIICKLWRGLGLYFWDNVIEYLIGFTEKKRIRVIRAHWLDPKNGNCILFPPEILNYAYNKLDILMIDVSRNKQLKLNGSHSLFSSQFSLTISITAPFIWGSFFIGSHKIINFLSSHLVLQ